MKQEEKNEILEFAQKHGNNFHVEVNNKLKQKGYNVITSPFYCDNQSNKSREIDIFTRIKKRKQVFYNKREGDFVSAKILIECKYIPTNMKNIFWFFDRDTCKTDELITKNTSNFLDDPNKRKDFHYYGSAEEKGVAKLFTTINKGNLNNVNISEDIFFKAINQCLNSLIHYRDVNSDLLWNDKIIDKTPKLFFPVIICNSFENFFGVYQENDIFKIEKFFQIEINYAYKNEKNENTNEYFLLDVVDNNFLDKYFEIIEKDISTVLEKIPIIDSDNQTTKITSYR